MMYNLYYDRYFIGLCLVYIRAYLDGLDGYIARKFKQCSEVGEIYDQGDDSSKEDLDTIKLFLSHCNAKLGSKLFTSPRTVIRSYLNLRDILNENPEANIKNLIDSTQIEADIDPELGIDTLAEKDSDLVDFKL